MGRRKQTQHQAAGGKEQRPLPHNKQYHFFVSHKKRHSSFGNTSEQLAIGLHDALETLGFVGFLDIDNLQRISQKDLMIAVRDSCALLVCLNDESCDSEWCRLEWEVARQFGIPALCIIDLRFDKQQLLDQVSSVNDHLLLYPWTDYTEKTRRSVVAEIQAWIEHRVKEDVENPERSRVWRAHDGGILTFPSQAHSPSPAICSDSAAKLSHESVAKVDAPPEGTNTIDVPVTSSLDELSLSHVLVAMLDISAEGESKIAIPIQDPGPVGV